MRNSRNEDILKKNTKHSIQRKLITKNEGKGLKETRDNWMCEGKKNIKSYTQSTQY